MAFSEILADEIRARIGAHPGVSERQMFGGIAFMINGNMAVRVSGKDLMVRVGAEAHEEALFRQGTREFDLSSRPSKGWLLVSPDGLQSDADLASWIDQGVSFAESPPK